MLRQNAKSYPGCWVSGWVTDPVSWSYRFSFCRRGVRYIGVEKHIEFEPINIRQETVISRCPTFCNSVVWLTPLGWAHIYSHLFARFDLSTKAFGRRTAALIAERNLLSSAAAAECCCYCWVMLLLSAAAVVECCCCWVLLLLLSATAAATTFNSFASPPPAF